MVNLQNIIALAHFRFFREKSSHVLASLQVSSLQASTHTQTKGHGRVHVNTALEDEFKLSETYLLSSQTINQKLPI